MDVDLEYAAFVRRVRTLTGLDLEQYKAPQMRRRLGALLARTGVPSLTQYAHLLERDPARRQEFLDFCTINVSEFFRDRERWDALQRSVLPELLRERPALQAWSAGCSNGAEPYSLAILLEELAPGRPHRLLATDVDRTVLARAMAGADYTAADLRNVDPARRRRWFVERAGRYAIVPALRRHVQFRAHDLLRDRFESGFDLILCRNVVIYFTEEAKAALYARFAQALRPGGVLFVGGTEIVSGAASLALESFLVSFYRKATGRGAPPVALR